MFNTFAEEDIMTCDARQERLERGKEIVEKMISRTPGHDPRYVRVLDELIVHGSGQIYYIDRAFGDDRNDGLSMAMAWASWLGTEARVAEGDVLVVNGSEVFVKKTLQLRELERALKEAS